MHAGLIVPMSAGGRTLGAITLVSAESGRSFGDADVQLAEELARRAGTAIENARLYTERSHIARTLQAGLLPGRIPQTPGWQVATLYRPAGDENWVGGDFYDVFAVHGGWLAIVGDVAGHGAEATALTGLARHTLRTAAKLLDDPLDAIRTLNAELRARERMSLCSVAVLLREDGDRASAEMVCAGHPLPLLIREGQAAPVGRFSPMLGAYDVEDWCRTTIALEPLDVLVLYTDGVFDAVGADGRFGEERLRATLMGRAHAQDAVGRIDAALSAFEVGPQADDTAVLAVQRVGVAAQRVAAPGSRRAPATTRTGHDRPGAPRGLPHARRVARRRRRRRAQVRADGRMLAPTIARAKVSALLGALIAADDLTDVAVLVSEIVTNAVRHAGAGEHDTIVVHLAISADVLRVEVCDHGPGFAPPARPQRRSDGGGNGLVLRGLMSSSWGVATDDGTCVWFERPITRCG